MHNISSHSKGRKGRLFVIHQDLELIRELSAKKIRTKRTG